MTTEENKRMLALSYIVADLKAENIEMTQRVHQLVDNSVDSAREVTRPSHGHHALAPSHVGVCQPSVLAVLGKVSPCLQ